MENLSRREFEYYNRTREFGGTQPRACGQTFRNLLTAAHAASVGDRVTLWCHTEFIARSELQQFINMFHVWGFDKVTSTMVRQRNSDGFVLFCGLPTDYRVYIRMVRGNETKDIIDI